MNNAGEFVGLVAQCVSASVLTYALVELIAIRAVLKNLEAKFARRACHGDN